jgi:hypothetical protein
VFEYIIKHILIDVHITVVKWRQKKKVEVFKCKARKKINWKGVHNGQTTQLLEVYSVKLFLFVKEKKTIEPIIIDCLIEILFLMI